MHRYQPSTYSVDEMMQHVRIRDSIYCRIDCDSEQHYISNVAGPAIKAWDHLPASESFHEDEVRHDGEDVVVGGERGEPVHGKIAGPDKEDWDVDG